MSTELETLIAEKTRRLHQRQIQEARMGYSTPPEVLMEIEDLTAEIKALKAQLKAAANSTPRPDLWREQRRAELTRPLDSYNQQIAAMQKDLALELDGQRRVVLKDRLADTIAERDKLQAELDALDA